MFGGGADLEYVAEGIQRFGCGWALLVEMWAEEGIVMVNNHLIQMSKALN
jgi:hypothetical protein